MSGTVTMYSTTWCGYCRRLKGQMDREGIAYTEVNIEQDPESAAFVEKANGGNQTVPTVLFPDGSTLTNPSLAQVKQKIGASGPRSAALRLRRRCASAAACRTRAR